MHLIKHRALGDLESGAGAGHDLRDGESYGPPTMLRDTTQPAQQQDNTGLQKSWASPVVLMTKKTKNILEKCKTNCRKDPITVAISLYPAVSTEPPDSTLILGNTYAFHDFMQVELKACSTICGTHVQTILNDKHLTRLAGGCVVKSKYGPKLPHIAPYFDLP